MLKRAKQCRLKRESGSTPSRTARQNLLEAPASPHSEPEDERKTSDSMNQITDKGRKLLVEDSVHLRIAAERLEQLGRETSSLSILQHAAGIAPADLMVNKSLFDLAFKMDEVRIAQVARNNLTTHHEPEKIKALKIASPQINLEIIDEISKNSTSERKKSAGNRVLYVLHNSRPFSNGGYATRGHGLAHGLRGLGMDVVCLTRPGFPIDMDAKLNGDQVPESEAIDGVPYFRDLLPLREKGHNTKTYAAEAANVIERRIRQLGIDCVLAASAYVSSLPALAAARRVGIPFIYEVRGLWEVTRYSGNPALEQSAIVKTERFLETCVARNADAVLTLTGGMRDELIRRMVSPEKITIIPNSCDPDQFQPLDPDLSRKASLSIPEDVPVIGYLGTFVQYEGLDDLARACGLLHRRGVDFRLLLVGSENPTLNERGPIASLVANIAAEEGISDKLIMPGRVPHDEIRSLYSIVDIAPFPRKPQPVTEMVSPMKPLEALAMEKAVVVSSVQALQEMVHHEQTGLVFEKGNVEALAESLYRLIQFRSLGTKLGKAGRQWVIQQRSWSHTSGMAENIIRGVCRA